MVHGDVLAEFQEMVAIMHGNCPCGVHGLVAAMHGDHLHNFKGVNTTMQAHDLNIFFPDCVATMPGDYFGIFRNKHNACMHVTCPKTFHNWGAMMHGNNFAHFQEFVATLHCQSAGACTHGP